MAGEDRMWIGRQASRRKAICQVLVDGVDVTARLDPHLISVTVTDKEGEGTDHCAIELDDRDARLAVPADDVMLEVWLGWHTEEIYEIFTGKVQSVESGFGRKHGGRRLWIDALGAAMSGKGRTPMQMSWGTGAPPGKPMGEMISLKTVLEEAAKHAGYAMHIAPELANIKRDTAAHQFTTIAPPSEERVHGPDAPVKPSDLERGDRPPSRPEKSDGAERWLAISALELGVHETPGRKSTPRVMEYRKIAGCNLRGDDSEVPWCRIYVGAIMVLAGLPFPKNWMARAVEHDPDFVKLSGPALGAVVSMWRGSPASGQGHTGFYRGETSTLIRIEGGNESDAVRRAFFPRYGPSMGLIGYYWPKCVPLPKIGAVRVSYDGKPIGSAV